MTAQTWRDALAAQIAAETVQADVELSAAKTRATNAAARLARAHGEIADFISAFGAMADRLQLRGGDLSPVIRRFFRSLEAEIASAKAEVSEAGAAANAAKKRKDEAAAATGQLLAVTARATKNAA